MRIFDKQEKVGQQKVVQMLSRSGFERKLVEKLNEFTGLTGTNEQKLAKVEKMIGDSIATAELRKTLELLKAYRKTARWCSAPR